MMNTITVVSQVSFQLGQVTFDVFAHDFAEELHHAAVRLTGAGTGKSFPALSAVFFVASAT